MLYEFENSTTGDGVVVQESATDSNGPLLHVVIDKISMTIALCPNYISKWGEGIKKTIIANAIALEKKELDGGHGQIQMGISPGPRDGYKVGFRIHPTLVKPKIASAENSTATVQLIAPAHDMNEWALVQVAPRSVASAHFVRLEWNPAKCGPQFWQRIVNILETFLMVELNPEFITVTRLDVAVDLPGVQIGDFAWEARKKRCRALYLKAGELQTVYSGKKRENCVVIYDKAAQLKQPPEVKRTRAEVRLRPQKKAKDWGDVANPFKWVKVRDVLGATLPMSTADKISFLDSVQQRGLSKALLARSSVQRKVIREAIEGKEVPFWKPELFWAIANEKLVEALS